MKTRLVSRILLLALPLHLGGCTVKKRVAVPAGDLQLAEHTRIVAVTTTDGREIEFLPPGGVIRGEKVTGEGPGSTSVEIPADQATHQHLTRGKGGEQRIDKLTTRDGREVRFVPPGGLRQGGSISGVIYESTEVPVAQVQRYWLEKSKFSAGRTIGLVLFGLLAAVAIAAASDSPEPTTQPPSCPFVYSWDGQRFVFDGEPFGGATTRGLERDDYSELEHLQAQDGRYRLMISNEIPETQFTNLMELWVVDHPADRRVVADEWGGLHALSSLQPPRQARDGQGRDLLPWLAGTDRLIWEPAAVPDAGLRREVVMDFEKPTGARSMRLVAHAATGIWGSYMIREMLALRGRDLEAWYASIDGDRKAAEELLAWNLREELYVLKVEVEGPEGFEVRGLLPGGGPLISEDRVVKLDLRRVEGRRVRLRLRPPAGFWALNSFAADFGPDQPLSVQVVKPTEAREEGGRDRLADLSASDDRYYEMPRVGDRGYVVFPAPPAAAGKKRTVFLHSRGHYRLHLPVGGEPQREALQQLADVPGAAARLAAERYAEWDSERLAQR